MGVRRLTVPKVRKLNMFKENFIQRQGTTKLLWLEWTVATLIGYMLGILAIFPWMVGLAYAAQPTLLIGLAGGAVLGGAIGGAQWLVLRHHTRKVDGWWL